MAIWSAMTIWWDTIVVGTMMVLNARLSRSVIPAQAGILMLGKIMVQRVTIADRVGNDDTQK
ncbi:hypothetical protein WG906_18995 [Pedobacter sp. P351]|uniref:hypothetical protein n=1 Tax=Pedobacter superstes TaxID=3133441 RepID=UPI003098FA26